MEKGQLVPDEVTIKMLKAKVEENPNVKGYIFDGFPRTIPQAEAVDKLLEGMGESVSKLIMLDVSDEELIKRLLNRGKTSGRADDVATTIISNRLSVYKGDTYPVFEFYKEKGIGVKTWGEGALDMVFKRLCLEIDHL